MPYTERVVWMSNRGEVDEMTERVVDFIGPLVWIERETEPFDNICVGQIVEGKDGFRRFSPSGHELNCGHMRRIMVHISGLNSNRGESDG